MFVSVPDQNSGSENEFEDAVNYHDQPRARDPGSEDASLNNFVQQRVNEKSLMKPRQPQMERSL